MAFIYKPDGFGGEEEKKNIFQPRLSKLLSSCSASLMVAAWAARVRRDLETTNNGKAENRKVSQFTVRVAIPDREGGGGEGLALLNARQW